MPQISPTHAPAIAQRLSAAPNPDDAPRWLALLDSLDVDKLTGIFLSLISDVPGYDPAPIPKSEIVRSAKLSFAALIEGLRAGGMGEGESIAHHVGVSRARADIPLTALMTAIRNDFSVLWEGLLAVSEKSDAELLVRYTGILLRTVDQYVSQTQQAYVAERRRMDDEASSVRQGLVAALFQEPLPTGVRLDTIAADLGIPPDASYSVAVALGDDIAALRVFVSESERAGAVVHAHHSGDGMTAFTHSPAPAGTRLAEIQEQLFKERIGFTRADGLADLAHSARVARSLARLFVPGEQGAMTWARGWARLANRHLIAEGAPVIADVQAALQRCGQAERLRLEEAVRSYLHTGSIGDSAAALFCHRNTIANRLRRFAELTGVDPLIPEDAARIVVGWA